MPLHLVSLLPPVRRRMTDEIDSDARSGTIYVCPRLSGVGRQDYLRLLLEAAAAYNDSWLADELRRGGRLNTTEQRRKPSGGFTTVKVPYTAAETLAEGEFNCFYVRGLCLHAIDENIQQLVVYRAKPVSIPRPESEMKIGMRVEPRELLADLRTHKGVEPALGIPPGPNSGLSVRLP